MFCGRETCFLTVREEHGLRQFSAEGVSWSGILDQTSDQVRKNKIGRACDTFVDYQRSIEVLARRSVTKRLLGRRQLR